MSFLFRIRDVVWSLVPAIRFFIMHGVVRLHWRDFRCCGVFTVCTGIRNVMGIELPLGRAVANGLLLLILALGWGALVIVESTHPGFTLGMRTLIVVRRVGALSLSNGRVSSGMGILLVPLSQANAVPAWDKSPRISESSIAAAGAMLVGS